jgi:hypothetical protein
VDLRLLLTTKRRAIAKTIHLANKTNQTYYIVHDPTAPGAGDPERAYFAASEEALETFFKSAHIEDFREPGDRRVTLLDRFESDCYSHYARNSSRATRARQRVYKTLLLDHPSRAIVRHAALIGAILDYTEFETQRKWQEVCRSLVYA